MTKIVKKSEIIKKDDNQAEPILLNLQKDSLTVNQTFQKVLAEVPTIVKRSEDLLKTDVNEINEDEMTNLNRDIKPIIGYEKKFTDFRKQIKKMLQERDNVVLSSLDQTLTDAGFDKIPAMTKKLRQLQKDFKANRANQRWEQLEELFNAQMDTYPELQKYAPETLGNFNYYRVHHADMVSEAKTKPVNNATIKQLNDDLNNYHNDLSHLLDSTLSPVYYKNVIEQYAAEPNTNNMLGLVDKAMAQQIKDQNSKLIQTIEVKAKGDITNLWYANKRIQDLFDAQKPEKQNQDEFDIQKLKLMKLEANAMLRNLKLESFLQDGQIEDEELESTIRSLIKDAFARVETALTKSAADYKIEKKPEEKPKAEVKEPVKEIPYKWLLDYLQVSGWKDIHDHNSIKVTVLNDLFTNIRNPESVWHENIKSNKEVIETVKYITSL